MSSSHIAGSKRPREDTVVAPELTPAILAVLAASEVLHTGLEGAARSTLDDAVAVLPFSSSNTHRYLAAIALAGVAPPPFAPSSSGNSCSSVSFLAPMYPALQSLAVADAARAWVLVDMLCLDATKMLEDDLVQRYAENPSAEADWRAALAVDGCPAADTLWELVTSKYAALRKQWGAEAPLPTTFGLVPSGAQRAGRVAWQQGINMSVLNSVGEMTGAQLTLVGVLLAPTILAVLRHQADVGVSAAAFRALEKLGSPGLYFDGYITALGRLSSDSHVVTSVARMLDVISDTLGSSATLLAAGVVPPLVAALTRYRDSDADIASNVEVILENLQQD